MANCSESRRRIAGRSAHDFDHLAPHPLGIADPMATRLISRQHTRQFILARSHVVEYHEKARVQQHSTLLLAASSRDSNSGICARACGVCSNSNASSLLFRPRFFSCMACRTPCCSSCLTLHETLGESHSLISEVSGAVEPVEWELIDSAPLAALLCAQCSEIFNFAKARAEWAQAQEAARLRHASLLRLADQAAQARRTVQERLPAFIALVADIVDAPIILTPTGESSRELTANFSVEANREGVALQDQLTSAFRSMQEVAGEMRQVAGCKVSSNIARSYAHFCVETLPDFRRAIKRFTEVLRTTATAVCLIVKRCLGQVRDLACEGLERLRDSLGVLVQVLLAELRPTVQATGESWADYAARLDEFTTMELQGEAQASASAASEQDVALLLAGCRRALAHAARQVVVRVGDERLPRTMRALRTAIDLLDELGTEAVGAARWAGGAYALVEEDDFVLA